MLAHLKFEQDFLLKSSTAVNMRFKSMHSDDDLAERTFGESRSNLSSEISREVDGSGSAGLIDIVVCIIQVYDIAEVLNICWCF